jgi:hypothetical protein
MVGARHRPGPGRSQPGLVEPVIRRFFAPSMPPHQLAIHTRACVAAILVQGAASSARNPPCRSGPGGPGDVRADGDEHGAIAEIQQPHVLASLTCRGPTGEGLAWRLDGQRSPAAIGLARTGSKRTQWWTPTLRGRVPDAQYTPCPDGVQRRRHVGEDGIVGRHGRRPHGHRGSRCRGWSTVGRGAVQLPPGSGAAVGSGVPAASNGLVQIGASGSICDYWAR